MRLRAMALSILVSLAACDDNDPVAPAPGESPAQGSGGQPPPDTDDGDDGGPVGCVQCDPPSCSIGCVPHTVDKGDSTTFFWNSDGDVCRLVCDGRDIDMEVPCAGDNTELFQDLQESLPCVLTAHRGEVESDCTDTVIVLGN